MWFAGSGFYMPVVPLNLLCSWTWLWNSLPRRPADHVKNMGLMCNRRRFYKTHVQRSGGPLLKWNQHRLLAWLRSKDLGLRSHGRSCELYEAIPYSFASTSRFSSSFGSWNILPRSFCNLLGVRPLLYSQVQCIIVLADSSFCAEMVLRLILAAGPMWCPSWYSQRLSCWISSCSFYPWWWR